MSLKRYIWFIVLLTIAIPSFSQAQIVNNSGSTPADSLTIPFFLLDSIGDMTAIAPGDSVFLWVFYPSGALAFEDSGAYDDADITTKTRHGMSSYTWQAAVADIDGTPVQGSYAYVFMVHDKSSADLWTPHKGMFQLLTETDFNTSMEYVKDVLDTLQNHDDWLLAGRSAIGDTAQGGDEAAAQLALIIDSLYATLDSIQNHNAWLTAFVDTLLANGFVTYSNGADSILRLNGLYVVANRSDTAAVLFANNNSLGIGFRAKGVMAGLVADASGSGGIGFWAYGPAGYGAKYQGTVSLYDFYMKNARTYTNILGTTTPTDTTERGAEIDTIRATVVVDDTTASGADIASPGDTMVAADTTISGAEIDTIGHFSYGGAGANNMTILALDTSAGTGTGNVELTVRNASGTIVGWQYTASSGTAAFTLDDGTYTIQGQLFGYGFAICTTVVSADITDTVRGAEWSTTGPTSASLCRVYGYVRNSEGEGVAGVRVWATPNGANITDTAKVIISPFPVGSIASDTSGYWRLDLYRSMALSDTNDYNIEGWLGPVRVFTVPEITIPSASTFDIADTVGGR